MTREEDVFAEIYEKKLWDPHRNGEARSGWGSTLKNSEPYIQFLQLFLRLNAVRSVVDVGCGDWSFSQHIQWGNSQYIGIDVVQSVIEANRKKFSSPTVSFIQANALEFVLPAADLLLCKDVLMHLPNASIRRLLGQFQKFKHCLITNDIGPEVNRDIRVGESRPIDLSEAPFCVDGLKLFTYHTDHGTKQVYYMVRKSVE